MPAPIDWTAQMLQSMRLMRSAGAAWHDIADMLGIGRQAVTRKAFQLGIYTPLPKMPPAPPVRSAEPLPPGHPAAWELLTAGTSLHGVPYPITREQESAP